MVPTSQKAGERPISFLLYDGVARGLTNVNLVVRPEDLSRVEPSTFSATRTLGGAWIDDFGPGIANIQISGHTGWRGGIDGDGEASFKKLRDTVFVNWHRLREVARSNGRNPDVVKLIFADALDGIVSVVAPGQMVLKRNRSRPLLMMYQIPLTVLSDKLDDSTLHDILSTEDTMAAGVDSLTETLRKLEAYAADVRNWIDSNIVEPIEKFLAMANTAFARVLEVVNTVQGIVDAQANQLIGLASDIADVGRNAFYTYNAVMNLPDAIKFQVSQVASAFENAFCVLQNAFQRVRLYPDYADVYGSSACSSTSGGSPLSPLRFGNAFEQITPNIGSPVSVTSEAQASIGFMKATDPALEPTSVSNLAAHLSSIGRGVAYQSVPLP